MFGFVNLNHRIIELVGKDHEQGPFAIGCPNCEAEQKNVSVRLRLGIGLSSVLPKAISSVCSTLRIKLGVWCLAIYLAMGVFDSFTHSLYCT